MIINYTFHYGRLFSCIRSIFISYFHFFSGYFFKLTFLPNLSSVSIELVSWLFFDLISWLCEYFASSSKEIAWKTKRFALKTTIHFEYTICTYHTPNAFSETRELCISSVLEPSFHSDKYAIYYNNGGGTVMSFFTTLKCYHKTIQNQMKSLARLFTHSYRKCKSLMCRNVAVDAIAHSSINAKITQWQS